MKAAILDYGAGNLHSLSKAVRTAEVDVVVTSDVSEAIQSDVLLLPGVGAFGIAAEFLRPHRGDLAAAIADGLPCLAICLGMQLLFEESQEGPGSGLGVFQGRVRRLVATRVPQIGWNDLEDAGDRLFESSGLTTAYFANSFVCEPAEDACVTSWVTHETDRFAASVRTGNTVGVQFHPEKSSTSGLAFLRAFLRDAER